MNLPDQDDGEGDILKLILTCPSRRPPERKALRLSLEPCTHYASLGARVRGCRHLVRGRRERDPDLCGSRDDRSIRLTVDDRNYGAARAFHQDIESRDAVTLNNFHLLAPRATPAAMFDFSAPSLRKRIRRLAVSADFIFHQIDSWRFTKELISRSAQRLLPFRSRVGCSKMSGTAFLRERAITVLCLE